MQQSDEDIIEEIQDQHPYTRGKTKEMYKLADYDIIKITFSEPSVAQRAKDEGMKLFGTSIVPSQIEFERYTQIRQCMKCYSYKHVTRECSYQGMTCSECAATNHTWQDCRAQFKRCAQCKGDHRTFSALCLFRKDAIKATLAERERIEAEKTNKQYSAIVKQAQQSNIQTTKQVIQQTLKDQPKATVIELGTVTNTRLAIAYLHAHCMNLAEPGSFHKHLNEMMQKNGFPPMAWAPNRVPTLEMLGLKPPLLPTPRAPCNTPNNTPVMEKENEWKQPTLETTAEWNQRFPPFENLPLPPFGTPQGTSQELPRPLVPQVRPVHGTAPASLRPQPQRDLQHRRGRTPQRKRPAEETQIFTAIPSMMQSPLIPAAIQKNREAEPTVTATHATAIAAEVTTAQVAETSTTAQKAAATVAEDTTAQAAEMPTTEQQAPSTTAEDTTSKAAEAPTKFQQAAATSAEDTPTLAVGTIPTTQQAITTAAEYKTPTQQTAEKGAIIKTITIRAADHSYAQSPASAGSDILGRNLNSLRSPRPQLEHSFNTQGTLQQAHPSAQDLGLKLYTDEKNKGKFNGRSSEELTLYIKLDDIRYTFTNTNYSEASVKEYIHQGHIHLTPELIIIKKKGEIVGVRNGLDTSIKTHKQQPKKKKNSN